MDSSQGKKSCREGKGKGPYTGVRWNGGKWVSEIRIPKRGKTVWLGSHSSPEMAALAFDAASYCVNGETKPFNFPDSKRPALDKPVGSLTIPEIQNIAAQFSCLEAFVAISDPHQSLPPRACQESPKLPILNDSHNTKEVCLNKANDGPPVEVEPYIPSYVADDPYIPNALEAIRMLDGKITV